jgi:hypothetical protein
MDIIFCLHRQIKIDDMRNRWHVNAARGHIGCNHDLNSAFKQHPDDPVTGMLRQIAMQCSDRVTCLPQAPGLIFSRQFSRHENDGLIHSRSREDGIQQTVLVIEIVGVMNHFGQQGAVDTLGQFDPLGISRQTPGDRSHAPIERGRKQ